MRHLKAFYVFHVAAHSKSYNQAAEKLNITHGAVSKQVKQLEHYLGFSLFAKQGRSVELTVQGRNLASYTAVAFDALETGVAKLSHQPWLEVSCEPTLTMRWLMPRLSEYLDSNNADVRLSTAGGPVKLGDTGLNMAIRRDDFPIADKYVITPLVDEWVGPVVSPYYWKQVAGDWKKIKLLHSQTRLSAWPDWVNSQSHLSLSTNSSQSFAHFYFALQGAVDGLGAAIGSYPLVMDDIKRGNLIAPFGFVRSGHQYVLLSTPEQNDLMAKDFTHWLVRQLSRSVP